MVTVFTRMNKMLAYVLAVVAATLVVGTATFFAIQEANAAATIQAEDAADSAKRLQDRRAVGDPAEEPTQPTTTTTIPVTTTTRTATITETSLVKTVSPSCGPCTAQPPGDLLGSQTHPGMPPPEFNLPGSFRVKELPADFQDFVDYKVTCDSHNLTLQPAVATELKCRVVTGSFSGTLSVGTIERVPLGPINWGVSSRFVPPDQEGFNSRIFEVSAGTPTEFSVWVTGLRPGAFLFDFYATDFIQPGSVIGTNYKGGTVHTTLAEPSL